MMGNLKEIMVVDDKLEKPFGMNQFIDTVISALETERSESKRRKNAA